MRIMKIAVIHVRHLSGVGGVAKKKVPRIPSWWVLSPKILAGCIETRHPAPEAGSRRDFWKITGSAGKVGNSKENTASRGVAGGTGQSDAVMRIRRNCTFSTELMRRSRAPAGKPRTHRAAPNAGGSYRRGGAARNSSGETSRRHGTPILP